MLLNRNYRLLRRSPSNSFYSRPNPKSVCIRSYHGWNFPLKWRENRSARNRTCMASSVSLIPMNESRSAFMLSMPICVVSSCCRTKIAITFHWNLLEAIPLFEFTYLIFYWCISICFKSKRFFARTVTLFAVTSRSISWTDALEAALHRFDQSHCERTVGRYVFQQSSHFVMTFAHHIYIVQFFYVIARLQYQTESQRTFRLESENSLDVLDSSTWICGMASMIDPSLILLINANPAPLSVIVNPSASSDFTISISFGRPFRWANMKSSRPIWPPSNLVISTLCEFKVQKMICKEKREEKWELIFNRIHSSPANIVQNKNNYDFELCLFVYQNDDESNVRPFEWMYACVCVSENTCIESVWRFSEWETRT